ncbi:MAG: tail fiber domain-containing protein, partial [Candidatus Paceibacterota bacterium]
NTGMEIITKWQTSEAPASNPSALWIGHIGHATLQTGRTWKIQTTEQGVNSLGSIALQADGGYVGIGTTAPGHLLDLGGGTYADSGGSWHDASDIRFKTDITPLSYGLDEIIQLNPISYTNTTGYSARQLGFSAQEMQTIIPELVEETNGRLSMTYGRITPVLVNAIKELNLKLESINEFKVDEEGNDIVNTFRDNLTAWLANAGNQITRIFTGEVCLTDPGQEAVCINRTELESLKALIIDANSSGNTPTPTPTVTPTSTPEATTTPTPTPTSSPESTPTPTPEATTTPTPDPTPTPTS